MTVSKRLGVILLAVTVLLALPQPARAKTIKVGDGTAASCTEAALQNALVFAAGEKSSVIEFRCGAAPIAITVTATLTPPDNTTIDGDGLVRLQGNIPAALMASVGGAFLNSNTGTLVIDSSSITGNTAALGRSGQGTGGGVSNQGILRIRNSLVTGNAAAVDGGGIYSVGGTLTLNDTIVFGNTPNNVVQ